MNGLPRATFSIPAGALLLAALAMLACDSGRVEPPPPAARSPRPPATNVSMTQVTFAQGVEEFPAFAPGGDRIAFCAEDDSGRRQVFTRVIETREQTQVTSGDYDHIQPAWSPDGGTVLFVRSRIAGTRMEPGDVFGAYIDGDIWSHDVDTGKERLLVENAFAPAFSADGTQLAFNAAWSGPNRIYRANRRGRNPEQVTTDSTETTDHLNPSWSRDGSKIVYVHKNVTRFDVQAVDLETRRQVWITRDLAQDLNPVWDPAADAVYFSSYRSGGLNVWRVPTDGLREPTERPQQVTTGPGQDVQIAFTRDGGRMAFTVMRQNADLFALDISPSTGRPSPPPYSLESTTREDSRGVWSPDSKLIAFNSDRSGHMNLWIKAIIGQGIRQVTNGPGGDYQPDWHPDQRQLVFFSSRSGNSDIWNVDIQSGLLLRLTSAPSLERNPFYSPDGRWIAYQSDATGRLELWVMRSDGTAQYQLADVGATGHFILWMNDSDRIVFVAPSGSGSQAWIASVSTGEVTEYVEVAGGSHMSKSPDGSLILDVIGHRGLWITPTDGAPPMKIFEFDAPDDRIDYPRWAPSGRVVVFDRVKPSGGDIWLLEGL